MISNLGNESGVLTHELNYNKPPFLSYADEGNNFVALVMDHYQISKIRVLNSCFANAFQNVPARAPETSKSPISKDAYYMIL